MIEIDRLVDSGPVELRNREQRHRFVRNPGDDISDLPTELQAVINEHWTQERVDSWQASILAQEPTVEELEVQHLEHERIKALRADVLYQDMVDKLKVATPQQISGFVDNNVTNLAGARNMFKRILLLIATDLRE